MFFRKDNGTGKIDTIIGAYVEIKGSINSKSPIRIDGAIDGTIESEEEVILGKDGKVKGDIKAKNILIGGYIEGNVEATEKVELLSGGELIGDIKAGTIVIDEGAVFTGSSKMATKSRLTAGVVNNLTQKHLANPQ